MRFVDTISVFLGLKAAFSSVGYGILWCRLIEECTGEIQFSFQIRVFEQPKPSTLVKSHAMEMESSVMADTRAQLLGCIFRGAV